MIRRHRAWTTTTRSKAELTVGTSKDYRAWCCARDEGRPFGKERLLFRVPFRVGADEQFVQSKFQELAAELQSLTDEAAITELDAVIDRHLKF